MSRHYSIDMILDLPFTQENVHFILQKASAFNLIYITDDEDEKLFNTNKRYLTVDQATIKILNMAANMDKYRPPRVIAQYENITFTFKLYKTENNLIHIGISIYTGFWDKLFKHGIDTYTFDFARYIRMLLNVCTDLTLLEIKTYADLLSEETPPMHQGCATACVSIDNNGFADLINNGFENKFIFFNEITNQPIEPSLYICHETFKTDFLIDLYAKKDDFSFKIEIKQDSTRWYTFLSIYPIKPYRMKKGYGSEEETIDVAFYLELLLELCENFAIFELYTFFNSQI